MITLLKYNDPIEANRLYGDVHVFARGGDPDDVKEWARLTVGCRLTVPGQKIWIFYTDFPEFNFQMFSGDLLTPELVDVAVKAVTECQHSREIGIGSDDPYNCALTKINYTMILAWCPDCGALKIEDGTAVVAHEQWVEPGTKERENI